MSLKENIDEMVEELCNFSKMTNHIKVGAKLQMKAIVLFVIKKLLYFQLMHCCPTTCPTNGTCLGHLWGLDNI